jgi:hypothetical protein
VLIDEPLADIAEYVSEIDQPRAPRAEHVHALAQSPRLGLTVHRPANSQRCCFGLDSTFSSRADLTDPGTIRAAAFFLVDTLGVVFAPIRA